MPVGKCEDQYIWAYTNHGSYSVKSGYWLTVNHPIIPLPQKTMMVQRRIKLKQRMWKLKTLPKIRFFLWRAVAGALAVADRLQTIGLNVDRSCKLCNQTIETICHVLFRCPTAELMLVLAHIPLPANGFWDSLEDNMEHMLNLMDD